MADQRPSPKPSFYKAIAVAFLGIGIVVIWAAVVRHEWVLWALGIMTLINAGMSWLKSQVPRETKR